MIRFDEGFVRYLPVPTSKVPPAEDIGTADDEEYFPFQVAMVFPFWAKIDTVRSFCSNPQDCSFSYDNRSAVLYQVYTDDSANGTDILDRANQEVRNNSEPKFSSFSASWVLVVTWLRLRPEEEFEGDVEEGIVSLP